MILDFLRNLFKNNSDKETKTFFDSKLGELTCEFNRKRDQFFFWNAILKTINKDKTETSITIEGSANTPYSNLLDIAYRTISGLDTITANVQNELNQKFPGKNIDLSKGYVVDDISFYTDDEVDYEIEFYSDNQEMVSVSFKNDVITELDLY